MMPDKVDRLILVNKFARVQANIFVIIPSEI